MKNEITAYMQSAAIYVLWVKVDAFHNATMVYLTGGGHVTNADLIYTRTGSGTIFCNDMEREEAAKTGFTVRTLSQYPLSAYTQASGGDPSLAAALRYQKMFSDAGITSGKIALYGMNEIGPVYGVYQHLARIMPEIELVGFYDDPILMPAMMSKDENEIERIRRNGQNHHGSRRSSCDFLTHRPVKMKFLSIATTRPVTMPGSRA
jgi:Xaa-Pro aminopeptidase